MCNFQDQIFRDPNGGMGKRNAWFSNDIHIGNLHTQTARAVDDRLFEKVGPDGHTQLFNIVLDALEQDDYCQFEVGSPNNDLKIWSIVCFTIICKAYLGFQLLKKVKPDE